MLPLYCLISRVVLTLLLFLVMLPLTGVQALLLPMEIAQLEVFVPAATDGVTVALPVPVGLEVVPDGLA